MNAKEVTIAAKAPEAELDLGSIGVSQPDTLTHDRSELKDETGTTDVPHISQDIDGSLPDEGDIVVQGNIVPVDDAEMIRQEVAATKTQAAFRGYLVMFLSWEQYIEGFVMLKFKFGSCASRIDCSCVHLAKYS